MHCLKPVFCFFRRVFEVVQYFHQHLSIDGRIVYHKHMEMRSVVWVSHTVAYHFYIQSLSLPLYVTDTGHADYTGTPATATPTSSYQCHHPTPYPHKTTVPTPTYPSYRYNYTTATAAAIAATTTDTCGGMVVTYRKHYPLT